MNNEHKKEIKCCAEASMPVDACCGAATPEQCLQKNAAVDDILNDQIITLQKQLDECLQARMAWQDKFMRVTADFENYKKRISKEQSAWMESAQANVLKDVLTIVDDVERAFENQPEVPEQLQSWINGFSLIRNALHKLLAKYGVEPMTVYENFDPQYHEALMQVKSEDKSPGTIVAVLQKGYLFKGSVLRHAKVSVAT